MPGSDADPHAIISFIRNPQYNPVSCFFFCRRHSGSFSKSSRQQPKTCTNSASLRYSSRRRGSICGACSWLPGTFRAAYGYTESNDPCESNRPSGDPGGEGTDSPDIERSCVGGGVSKDESQSGACGGTSCGGRASGLTSNSCISSRLMASSGSPSVFSSACWACSGDIVGSSARTLPLASADITAGSGVGFWLIPESSTSGLGSSGAMVFSVSFVGGCVWVGVCSWAGGCSWTGGCSWAAVCSWGRVCSGMGGHSWALACSWDVASSWDGGWALCESGTGGFRAGGSDGRVCAAAS
mmetsp:Transcript_32728/g.54867  ORF Transcript_32728/g.54867 Transcript_32728/m.54867 type:complete len:297 (-) Transcript_32728:951-1841(-)